MPKRPEKGRGLFYHRDSEGHSELAPPQYVEWARGEAARFGVTFTGTPEAITTMIAQRQSVANDLYLDYGISGNQLSRPGFDHFCKRAIEDYTISHLFVSKRDRFGRPDNPLDSMMIEFSLRTAGLTIVMMGGKVLKPFATGERVDIAELLTCMIDYDASGKFRRDLAEKLIHAKIKLASSGFSIGGEPLYGFRRWLCTEDGTRKRELETGEIVKMAGHHVVWLPTATKELAVVERILNLIETTPATRIARMLNDEGVPSPRFGRLRSVKGVQYEISGLWTQNTVRNIATHPLLIALCEYGKRSEGDQLRFTKDGPRILNEQDYHADGKLKTVANSDDQIIRTKAKSKALITQDKFDRIHAVIEHRGRHLKGKARTRGQSPNPLGGRIYDLSCGWLMYRYAKRKKWLYVCGLNQNSESKCCRHNTVSGELASQLVLSVLRQRFLNPSTLTKLKSRLHELAVADKGQDPALRQQESDKVELGQIRKKLEKVSENLALAETPDEGAVIREVFRKLKGQEAELAQRTATVRPASDQSNPQQQVDAALVMLDRLSDLADSSDASWPVVTEIFKQIDAKLYLRFMEVAKGRSKFNVPAGGVVTFGSTPPPSALYTGPTDRVIIRKMLASGESVTASPQPVASGESNVGQDVIGSANVQRVTKCCT